MVGCGKHPTSRMRAQDLLGLPRNCQGLPGAAKSCQGLPGAARSCQEFQELPKATRGCEGLLGAARSCRGSAPRTSGQGPRGAARRWHEGMWGSMVPSEGGSGGLRSPQSIEGYSSGPRDELHLFS